MLEQGWLLFVFSFGFVPLWAVETNMIFPFTRKHLKLFPVPSPFYYSVTAAGQALLMSAEGGRVRRGLGLADRYTFSASHGGRRHPALVLLLAFAQPWQLFQFAALYR